MNTIKQNPYVGPRTFEINESHLFFGREREALDLLSLVISERLVLFYAQSGAGKSSLINTKLIPGLLAEDEYKVLPVGRVGGGESLLSLDVDNIYVYNLINSLPSHDAHQEVSKLTLSKFLSNSEIKDDTTGNHVLIIDQFEELFSTHQEAWEKREDFFRQLAQAISDFPNLWVVLVMREDYIAYLDPYVNLLPGKLRVRYYMQRLERASALTAIKKPVETIRPFAEGVAENLVDDLSSIKTQKPDGTTIAQPGQFIESVQLQVVCYNLWESLLPNREQITDKDLQEIGDVSQSLERHYSNRVKEVADKKKVSERSIREWFEKKLITSGGMRNMVMQETRKSDSELDDDIIQALQSDLVRAEKRGQTTFYELTHDRLVEPILVNNKKWQEENSSILQRQTVLWDQQGRSEGLLLRSQDLTKAEKEAKITKLTELEKAFLTACLKLKEREMRERRRNRLTTLLAIGAMVALVFASLQWRSAQEQQKIAEGNLAQMTQLINDVSDAIQTDKVAGAIGFSPVQKELFTALLPYHQSVIDNAAQSPEDAWKIAQSHYQLALASDNLGESEEAQEEYEQAFNIAKQSTAELSTANNAPAELLIILNKSAVFYSWALMNRGEIDQTENILNEARSFMGNYQEEKNAELIMSFALLENAFSRLEIERNNTKDSLEHQRLAVDLARKAVALDKQNLVYQRSLAVYLRNLSNTDELLISETDSKKYTQEGCDIAKSVDQTPGSGILTLSVVIDCIYDESWGENPDENVARLLEAKNRLDTILQIDPSNVDLKLSRAQILTRLEIIEIFNKKDKIAGEEYFELALVDFLDVLGNGGTLPTDVWTLKSVYEDIYRNYLELESKKRIQIFKRIDNAIANSPFRNTPTMAFISGANSLALGELQEDSNPEESLAYFDTAILSFRNSRILDNISVFDERYEWVCRAYSRRLRLNYESKNTEAVLSDLKILKEICQPVFDKYQFDFYLLDRIWGPHVWAGELLFNEERYQEAIPILEYASYWGEKSSTLLLERIYREGLGVPVDLTKANNFSALASRQRDKLIKLTLTADFGNFKSDFYFYLYDKPFDYPYKGIDDQVEWLKQARGGTIPVEVADLFRDLHEEAIKDEISFPSHAKEDEDRIVLLLRILQSP